MGMCIGPNLITASALSGKLIPKTRYKVSLPPTDELITFWPTLYCGKRK